MDLASVKSQRQTPRHRAEDGGRGTGHPCPAPLSARHATDVSMGVEGKKGQEQIWKRTTYNMT